MTIMTNQIKNYFNNTKSYSLLRFIIELTLLAFALKILSSILWVTIEGVLQASTGHVPDLGQNMPEDIDAYALPFLILFVTLGPALETLLGQALPIKLVSRFTTSRSAKIIASALFFAVLHYYPFLIVNVFPVGLILAWSYLYHRQTSFARAFWVTTTIHALHNAIALGLQYLS
jgi:membrane protease YdiL (CAAX protease family)